MTDTASQPPARQAQAIVYLAAGRLQQAAVQSVSRLTCRARAADGRSFRLHTRKVIAFAPAARAAGLVAEAEALLEQIDMAELWRRARGAVMSTAELGGLLDDACGYGADARQVALEAAFIRDRALFSHTDDSWEPVSRERFDAVASSRRLKAERRELEERWTSQLDNGELPAQLAALLERHLSENLSNEEPDALFLRRYCRQRQIQLGHLAVRHGIAADLEDLHMRETVLRMPAIAARPESVPQPALAGLEPLAEDAIAIDSAGTVEVDDAFSVQWREDGTARIGVHIAAPALLASAEVLDIARERSMTVYLPSRKFMMLPAGVVEAFSLVAPAELPSVSMLLDWQPATRSVSVAGLQPGRIRMAANLAIEGFAAERVALADQPDKVNRALETLQQAAVSLAGDAPAKERGGFLVAVRDGEPVVTPRASIRAADRLVEAFMILYNQEAARLMTASDVPFISRVEGRLRVQRPAAGQPVYGWLTSPLRRFVDLCNQRQLLACLSGQPPPLDNDSLRGIVKPFERDYQWARQQQRRLETYWALRWLDKRKDQAQPCHASRMPGKVSLDAAPLLVDVPDGRLAERAGGQVRISEIDLYALNARGSLV